MYGIFSYICVIFKANVGKYSIHGASGIHWEKKLSAQTHFIVFRCCGLSYSTYQTGWLKGIVHTSGMVWCNSVHQPILIVIHCCMIFASSKPMCPWLITGVAWCCMYSCCSSQHCWAFQVVPELEWNVRQHAVAHRPVTDSIWCSSKSFKRCGFLPCRHAYGLTQVAAIRMRPNHISIRQTMYMFFICNDQFELQLRGPQSHRNLKLQKWLSKAQNHAEWISSHQSIFSNQFIVNASSNLFFSLGQHHYQIQI